MKNYILLLMAATCWGILYGDCDPDVQGLIGKNGTCCFQAAKVGNNLTYVVAPHGKSCPDKTHSGEGVCLVDISADKTHIGTSCSSINTPGCQDTFGKPLSCCDCEICSLQAQDIIGKKHGTCCFTKRDMANNRYWSAPPGHSCADVENLCLVDLNLADPVDKHGINQEGRTSCASRDKPLCIASFGEPVGSCP